MNKFKKLVPAICMLLVSAVLMGTSTYAWFSMNTSVTANNLGVTAKSNAQYLLIGTKDNATDKTATTETGTTVTSTVSDVALFPVTFIATKTEDTKIGNASIPTSITDTTNLWLTANNTNKNKHNDAVTNIKQVTESVNESNAASGAFASYVKVYAYYLTLDENSVDYSGKLTVTMAEKAANNTGDLFSGVKAVVKVGTTYKALASKNDTAEFTGVSITKSTSVKVLVYVYIDGEDSSVTTANIEAKKAISGKLDLSFDIEQK